MSIQVRCLNQNPEDYRSFIQSMPHSFLQTPEMFTVNRGRGRESDLLLFENEQGAFAACHVNYLQSHKILKLARIVHGPVLDYQDPTAIQNCLTALRQYLLKQKVDSLIITPYAPYELRPENEEAVRMGEVALESIKGLGFKHQGFGVDIDSINVIYVKDLTRFQSEEEILNSYNGNMRRSLGLFADCGVSMIEDEAEPHRFYRILQDTAARRGFSVPEFDYFLLMKKAFGDNLNFKITVLDSQRFAALIESESAKLDEVIAATPEESSRGKKVLKELYNQRDAWDRRREQLAEIQARFGNEAVELSCMMYLHCANETISVFGGTVHEYRSLGGPSVINDEMIRAAYRRGDQRYNFYGTFEFESEQEGNGNYKFKKNYNGAVEQLLGSFRYELSLKGRLIERFKQFRSKS